MTDSVVAFGLTERVTAVGLADGRRLYHDALISSFVRANPPVFTVFLAMMEEKLVEYAGVPVDMESVIFLNEVWFITDGVVSSVARPGDSVPMVR